MAEGFGTAIYTGCAPGQGLSAGGGMQFQSLSAGVGRDALALIRRHLIYEPPERLIGEQQPIEAFPPSFAHICNGVFATAAGIYIGREADGPRQGNHLTHAIVTSDARAYRSVRPAQMFHAPFWRTEPAETTQSEPLAAPWTPGPIDAAEASRFVNAQRHGTAMLSALLSALLAHVGPGKRADTRRVLFVAEKAEQVLHWLIAATLLIPQHEALRIGFKVFTIDPARSALPVVAVHPDWSRSTVTVDDDHGYAVFDLTSHRWTLITEQPDAQYWARRFCQTDPYDVAEAAELAATSGLSGAAALDLAAAAILGDVPSRANAAALVEWLRTGPPALREAYGGPVVRALAHFHDTRLLLQIDEITKAQFPGRSDETRLTLLRMELEDALENGAQSEAVRRGQSGATAAFHRRTVSAAAEPNATRLMIESLQKARGPAFDAVLRVAGEFGVSVPLEAVREATEAFVAYWADNPAAEYDLSAWPPSPPVHDMLRDELSSRIMNQPEKATAIADAWWHRLWRWNPDEADIDLPLHRALLSAAMLFSDRRTRQRIVWANLGRIPSPAPGNGYQQLAAVLWSRTSATTEEVRALCRFVPAGIKLDPAIFASVVAHATGDPVGLAELELCADLGQRQLLVLNSETNELLACHRQLMALEKSLGIAAFPTDMAEIISRAPSALLAAHAELLGRAMLTIDDPPSMVYAVYILPPVVMTAYLAGLCGDAQWSRRPARMALAYALSKQQGPVWVTVDPTYGFRSKLLLIVSEWRRQASRDSVQEVAARLEPLGAEMVKSWSGTVAKVRWFRLFRGRRARIQARQHYFKTGLDFARRAVRRASGRQNP